MNKSYSPVYVKNPKSLQHLVRLHPGQHFMLCLDETYGNPDVEVAGDYLKIESFGNKDGNNLYQISPKENLSDWSAYSACFLGEIWVGWKEGVAKLIVNLECSNVEKMEHITIVNPDCFDVRVRPYNVLEFVVYDEDFDWQDEWTWTWKPEIPFLEMERLGHDYLSLYPNAHLHQYSDNDPPNGRYARCPRTKPEKFFRQHHFWFRFGRSVLKLLDQNESIERAGNLEIIGTSNKFHKHIPTEGKRYIASLHLDLKKRYRAKILSSLGLQKREEGRLGGLNYCCSGGSVVHLSKPKKKVLPIVKDVVINKVTSSWQDCKSIPAKPQPNQFHNPYSQYDDENFIIGYPTCRNQRVLQYHRKFRGPD